MATTIQSDIRSALHVATLTILSRAAARRAFQSSSLSMRRTTSFRLRAFSSSDSPTSDAVLKAPEKPSICTADEIHYVSVSNSDWRLALWRYHPSPQAPPRNHPLLLLSGVGTNAIGYDLSPGSSFARHMSGQGFDTWILEVRGAGLSVQGSNIKEIKQSANERSGQMEAASRSMTNGAFPVEPQSTNRTDALAESETFAVKGVESESIAKGDMKGVATVWDESRLVMNLTETFMRLSERLSGFLSEGQSKIMSAKLFDQISKLLVDSRLSGRFNEIRDKLLGLLETRENSSIASQIRDLSQRILEDFQKQLDLIVKYDWDFDHYLEEDVPAAIEYVTAACKPKDGKLLAIGHSMGGILLYATLSRCGRDSRLAAIVTLASSLDYTSSKSTLKLLLPLADPAQALSVPVVPLGTLLAAAFPLSSQPPYVLSWLNNLISAEDMMHPELLKKLVLNNFCTIPAKLLLQLTTAFREGGLCDRSGTFSYKDHIHKSNVPILALAGDRDLICPPEAVEDTAKLIPEHLVTYKVFGEPGGPHYAHYDLVGGRLAVEQVYPCIVQFLSRHDSM
uniref:AB hydrolase-1 domain-containing protein n=1 Tax=Fagus sylvatica TaxID=28930 RepID=A0A2N9ICC5_FAGSY